MPGAASARVLCWNVERKAPHTPTGAPGIEHLFGQSPDVMAITEARTVFPTRGGHTLWSAPPRGTHFADDERKLLLWSREPWRHVDRVGAPGLDRTRFVAGTTDTPVGPLRVFGICIPWHMAEVTHPIDEKRKPWELHINYLEALVGLVESIDAPSVLAGDFNQTFPRARRERIVAAEALAHALATVDVVTSGQVDGCTKPGIDHIAATRDLSAHNVWGWPNVIDGKRLSDHDGVGVDLRLR